MSQALTKLLSLCWVLGWMSLCTDPLWKRVLVSHSPPVLPELRTIYFQNQMLWGFLIPVQVLRAGGVYPMWALNPLLPRETFIMPVISLQDWVTVSEVWVLIRPCYCYSYPSQCSFFLYIFSCGRAIQLAFRLFSESHSICSLNLGVYMRGSEVRILLVYHLIKIPDCLIFKFLKLFLIYGCLKL